MRHASSALVALVYFSINAPAPATASPRDLLPQQEVALHAMSGNGASDGYAWLTVVREKNGYRLHGNVESRGGCVALKAVNMHLGTYWGSDQITRTCESGVNISVDAWTHHTDVVLTAIISHGLDWDSNIVALTAKP